MTLELNHGIHGTRDTKAAARLVGDTLGLPEPRHRGPFESSPQCGRSIGSSMPMERSFCLLKSEAYLFGRAEYIETGLRTSGLEVVDAWKIKLTFSDVFRLYEGFMPRVTMTLRFLPLFYLDLFILRGPDAVRRMRDLKYRLRRDLWGSKSGGFLHAPDNVAEFNDHIAILETRRVDLSGSSMG